MATSFGVPARWTAWHSVMPRAIPPATGGGPDAGSSFGRAGLGEAAAAVAAWSAGAGSGGAGASDACAFVPAGTAQRPSALTMSSAPTGPCGPRLTPAVVGFAQSGLANTGFENQPPSF